VSAEEAAQQIDSGFSDVSSQASTLEEGPFSDFMEGFLDASNGGYGSAQWVAKLTQGVAENVVVTRNGRFDYEETTGVYEWSSEDDAWTRTGSSDDVVLQFPSSEGQDANDATLTMADYDDESVNVNGETVYLPTTALVSLTVDGTEVFSVDLTGVEYTQDGDLTLPTAFALEIFTAPHTHTFTLTENSSTDFAFGFELRGPEEVVTGLTVQAMLATDDYAELEDTDVEEVSGRLRIGPDLSVPYTVQVGRLAALDDPSEAQINQNVDATVEYDGTNLATLRYDDEEERIEVVYADGSTDPASDFLEPFVDDLESTFSSYSGTADLDDAIDMTPGRFFRP